MAFHLLSRQPPQRSQEVGCLVMIGLAACCCGAVAVSNHRAEVALKSVCDIAVVGKPFDRVRFEAEARSRGVFATWMPAGEKKSRDVDLAWAEKRALLYPKLCTVAVKAGIVQSVRFETYTPR